jgi:hypothetical protein
MTKLVVARLTGGLGNQLFQYAAACGVAHSTGAVAALDITEYSDGSKTHANALGRYRLDTPVVTATSFDPQFATAMVPAQDGLARIGWQGDMRLPVYREDVYEFEPALKSWPGSAYLYGFWQSWKYFDDVADALRARLKIEPRDRELSDRTGNSDTVAVHVRRGDYLSGQRLAAFGICEPAYYDAAMALLRRRLAKPHFYFFSDDPQWCQRHFAGADVTMASVDGGDATDDLAAMAHCRHHIIANSSLSWWGAWLGDGEGSIVVAPVPWYSQSPRARDLIPDHWIRLDRRIGAAWSPQRAPGGGLVSAIILARSTASALERAFASVKAQTYGNLDIIIALSTRDSDTARMAGQLRARDGATLVITASHPSAALTAAVTAAGGTWVAFLDDHDAWLASKIEIEIEAAGLTDADVVLSRTIPIAGPDGLPMSYPPPGRPDCSLEDLMADGHFIAGISHTVVRRTVLTAIDDIGGRLGESWVPGDENGLWPRLIAERRIVTLWQRLVESPIPFLRRSAPGLKSTVRAAAAEGLR